MSCAYPYLLKTNKYSAYTGDFYSYIPCGWCLNCRVDKQNQLAHRCEYELINYKCGAFVTLTYDDYHIVDKLRQTKNGLEATLSKDDLKHYLYRLRANIKNHLPDNILCNHHFKYLAVGEYGKDGQIFDRPHLHILFFGLDFAYCKKELERAWQGRGTMKILPILDGGIRYVLKYLDKQLFGIQAKQKYDDNNLERPFQTHSLGLGSKLYESQLAHINKYNGTYTWKGKEVPIPAYYKNKLYTKSNQFTNYKRAELEYKLYNGKLPKDRYDLHDFKIQKNLEREKNLNIQNRLHGRPLFIKEKIYEEMYGVPFQRSSSEYIKKLAAQAVNACYQVPF